MYRKMNIPAPSESMENEDIHELTCGDDELAQIVARMDVESILIVYKDGSAVEYRYDDDPTPAA